MALLAVVISQRPSNLAIGLAALILILILVADVSIVVKRRKGASVAALVLDTALVLFLLCMLLIWGPGRWSVDAYLDKAQPE